MAVSCEFCLENFEDSVILESHITNFHPGSSLPVKPDAEVEFVGVTNVNQTVTKSIKNQPSQSTVTCRLCSKSFEHIWQLEEHMGNVKHEPHVCHLCSKVTDIYELHISHVKSHQKGKKWICHLCRKSFDSEEQIISHIKNVKHATHKCQFCDKEFNIYNQLYKHIKTHTKPHKCKDCPETFSSVTTLKAHEARYHLGVKFDCTLCGKNFAYNAALHKHMKGHNGLYTHKCQYCPKIFVEKGQKNKT